MDLKSEVLTKSKKIDILQKVCFLSKNRSFSHMYFLSKKSQKEILFDILNSKECFLDLKREILKTSKKSTFSKGVRPWFLSRKRPFCYMFFLAKKPERNSFWYSGLKIKLFGPQKWSSHKVEKNRHFAKGMLSVKKSTFFSYVFFFEEKKPEKSIFWYSG